MNIKNEKIRILKKIICLSASFILCFSSFIIPSYASTPEFLILPQTNKALFNDGGNNQPVLIAKADVDYVYYFGVDSGSTKICYLVCDSSNALSGHVGTRWVNSPTSTATITMTSFQDTINQDFAIRSYNAGSGGSGGFFYDDVNVFSSLNEGLAALRDFLDNGPSEDLPNEGFDGTLLIEAGYVAYIRVNGGNMELSATMNELSGLSLGGSPWGNTSSIAYGVSDLPSQGTTFPLNSMSHIPWMKKAEGQNWLGQTRYAGYPKSDLTTSDNYIVIYNPAQPYLSSKGQDELSPTITAKFSKLVDYKKYPLTQSYDSVTGGTSSNSISDFDDFYNGEADSNGSFSETPSNNNMSPVATPGGTGDLATSGQLSVIEYIQQVNNTLTNFAKSVIDLLKAPISHVGELISAGSGFMGALRGLYAWLPVDIQGLVISALTVVIGIGVFKVFL